ncbi:hypothetical protein [Nocardioides sp. R-C-SC26]|uniref:hypothetical protein n=1 Tax=Nocardioides sp. R-C-SC26 TaxID=2870414 RepID=UPI001E63D207|nr:hypothetical protein [Nocardioides sp. R-C-SC26]
MSDLKAGDHVKVFHTCTTVFGTVDHEADVLVTSVRPDAVVPHARGVRCDGSLIEWSLREDAAEGGGE